MKRIYLIYFGMLLILIIPSVISPEPSIDSSVKESAEINLPRVNLYSKWFITGCENNICYIDNPFVLNTSVEVCPVDAKALKDLDTSKKLKEQIFVSVTSEVEDEFGKMVNVTIDKAELRNTTIPVNTKERLTLDEEGQTIKTEYCYQFYFGDLRYAFFNPEFSYENVTEEATLAKNIRSEIPFSHLNISDENIVLYMPFDVEHSSNNITYDYSNYDNDGTLGGNPIWNSSGGKFGGAYEFDGVDDYINFGNIFENFQQDRTISAWVYINDVNSDNIICSKFNNTKQEDDWALLFDKVGGISGRNHIFGYTVPTATTAANWLWIESSENIQAGQWYHVVVVHEWGVDAKIYVNGIEDTQYSQNLTETTATGSTNDFLIGRSPDLSGTKDFNGTIDEVAIWNRSLSASEIAELYNYSNYSRFYNQGNQTFELMNVSLGSDNRANVTVEGQALNDSSLKARVYEAGYEDVVNDNLVGYWHLDNLGEFGESTSLIYDFSGRGNNGTANGNPSVVAGKYNSAIDFDGANDMYILPDDIVDVTGDFSVSLWGNFDNNAQVGRRILSIYDTGGADSEFFYDHTTDGSVGWRIGGNAKITGGLITWGQWFHLIFVYRDGTREIWFNGVNESYSSGGIAADATFSALGGGYSTSAYELDGRLDEVMIFNRSLSADEIKEIYYTQSTDHANNGDGIDWTLTQDQVLETLNSSHLRNTYNITNTSDFILTELEYDSANGFYSPILQNAYLATFYQSEVPAADTTPPVLTFASPTDINTTVTARNWTMVNITGNEALSNCTLDWNMTTNYSMFSTSTTDWYYNMTDLPNENYTYYVFCNDTSGNIGNSSTIWTNINKGVDSCSYTLNNDWIISDDCVLTNVSGNIGTGTITIDTGGRLTLADSNFSAYSISVNTTEHAINIFWLNWSHNGYYFNITG